MKKLFRVGAPTPAKVAVSFKILMNYCYFFALFIFIC